jgi:hypothetical protein
LSARLAVRSPGREPTRLRAVGAAVLLAGRVALVVDQAGAAQSLGHRAVRRGRLGIAAVAGLGSPAPAVTGLGSPAPAVTGVGGTAAAAIGAATGTTAPVVAARSLAPPAVAAGTGCAAALPCALTALAASAIAASAARTSAARPVAATLA